MKVNDYVRSSWGTISRIKKYKHDEDGTGFSILIENECVGAHYKNKSQFDNDYKTSPNIMDLIEVGDYVNGYLVTTGNQGVGSIYVADIDGLGLKKKLYGKDIKSIVTKEQFEEMRYEIK